MKHIFSLPNLITLGRVLFIPVFVFVLFSGIMYRDYIAAAIFILLSASDALDGYLARRRKQITGVGKIIDPIADKLLIAAALFALSSKIPLWMIIVILSREVIITVARILFLPKKVISASILGKIKTISQIVAICAVILSVYFAWWLMLIAVIITIVSGIDYLIKMVRMLDAKIVTIPNTITLIRLLLVPFLILGIVHRKSLTALIIIGIIVIGDKLDGTIARLSSQASTLGRIFDAYVDFIVIVSSFIALAFAGYLPAEWAIVFAIPSMSLLLSKSTYFYWKRGISSHLMGKVLVGLSYAALVALLLSFRYEILFLVTAAVLAYWYACADILALAKISNKK